MFGGRLWLSEASLRRRARRMRLVVGLVLVAALAGVVLAIKPSAIGWTGAAQPVLIPERSAAHAPELSDGIPAAGRRTAVFFASGDAYGALAEALTAGATARFAGTDPPTDVVIILPARPGSPLVPAPVAYDPLQKIADEFGMPVPADGPRAEGWALVDSHGLIRYRTADRDSAASLDTVLELANSLP